MTKKIFYEKVGRRYKPVYEYDQILMDAMPKGTHLIQVYPGGKTTRYNVDPAYAPMVAAGRTAKDAMCESIRKASELRPSKTPVTEGQRQAWEKLSQEFGNELNTLQAGSIHDIAEAGIQAMSKEAEKLLKHTAVKEAYEHFMLVCKLCAEEDHVETR